MDNFCNIAKKMIKYGARDLGLCSALQLSAWWQRLELFMEEKNVANDEEVIEVEVQQKEVLEVD